jgi:hypothetical protein
VPKPLLWYLLSTASSYPPILNLRVCTDIP